MKQLTAEEKKVIVDKGTEAPFTGKYYKNTSKGTYLCRRCGAALYRSSDKFDSECGWPSFDDEIPGAVTRIRDADGVRTEILCTKCGAHLGHVFLGEGLTNKDTRHCVNSISLDFIPEKQESAIFAGGCFWGVEHLLQQQKGVISVTNGYTGGTTSNPSYAEVCEGNTGHVEAVEVIYDASQVDYETLAKLFFEIHDPTQSDRQGPDIGEQYRSEIFYKTAKQKEIAEKLINTLKAKGYKVVTKVAEAKKFWPAEKYHQDYYLKKGSQPYCHRYVKRF
ncbi:MAG: bifunctional methionine sulfoxide reductase B/A protein [Rikenellaceae bacterium]